ncbi:Ig-like domain-containing protein [Vibrio sp.]|uniref:Ig-like domain-containing protein n=1 Tax=Vibrio sp. TaxID=678 RepID=UPI003D0C71FE
MSIISPVDTSELTYNGIDPVLIETDVIGSINKVEFFCNSTKIGEDTDGSDGWRFAWHPGADGRYTLSAKATSNDGLIVYSNTVRLRIVSGI